MNLLSFVLFACALLGCSARQTFLHNSGYNKDQVYGSSKWKLSSKHTWDVLGPFPLHAREQHFLSPSFPIDLSKGLDIDLTTKYPSSLADNGYVTWSSIESDSGNLAISFPNIRWSSLRATEGWSVLQHHALLHTTFEIVNYQSQDDEVQVEPLILVDIRQASFFTILTEDSLKLGGPVWQNGNIYALPNAPSNILHLPSSPTVNGSAIYHIFVSGDYEIRLFGDPRETEGQEIPIQRLYANLALLQHGLDKVMLEEQLNVVPEFVGGWAFSNGVFGIGLKGALSEWTVFEVEIENPELIVDPSFSPFNLYSLQSRIIPIKTHQTMPFTGDLLLFWLHLRRRHDGSTERRQIKIQITHKPMWNGLDDMHYKATYLLGSMPLSFIVKPPFQPPKNSYTILALHGAGVEIDQSSWPAAIRRQKSNWIIFPSGRTSWGFDWHGPSSMDVWESFAAFRLVLLSHENWSNWAIRSDKVILVGHSNGGQGVWYQAGHYPDRVVAAIAAAAYIKSQLYVPYHHSKGFHFLDATLKGILESSLQPDDTDLFLSNLINMKLLSIHGGNDMNVPTWHSRELLATAKTWYPNVNISYHEFPQMPHWWDEVLSNDIVQGYLDSMTQDLEFATRQSKSFTLTTAIPNDAGSLQGWQIHELIIPGRLGRVQVELYSENASVWTTNIWSFSVDINHCQLKRIVVDGQDFRVTSPGDTVSFTRSEGEWQLDNANMSTRTLGPMNRLLTSMETIRIIIPVQKERLYSAATRIAHNLLLYLRIDAEIISDAQAISLLRNNSLGCSNIVIIGGSFNKFGELLASLNPSPVLFHNNGWTLQGHQYMSPGLGVAFLHPHPVSRCEGSMSMFMSSTNESGMERILRLFPLRTGVPVPEWIITGPNADEMGAGGLLGAGFWSRTGKWSDINSWLQ